MAQAAGWLTFLNRLQTARKPVTVYDQMLAEFRGFMEEDRGLSPATVKGCCSSVRPFLIQLVDARREGRCRIGMPYVQKADQYDDAIFGSSDERRRRDARVD